MLRTLLMLHLLTRGNLRTKFGPFQVLIFYDGQIEATVLQTLNFDTNKDVHLKMQSTCMTGHYFNSLECSCKEDSDSFQKYISTNGNGLLILLDQEGKGNGNVAHIASQKLKESGYNQDEAYVELGFSVDNRSYSIVPKILSKLNITSCLLHSRSERKLASLKNPDIECFFWQKPNSSH